MIVCIVKKVKFFAGFNICGSFFFFFFFSYLLLELRVWHGNDFGKIVLKKWLLCL